MVVLDFRFTYLIRDNVSMVHIVLPMYFQAGCLPNVLMMAKLSHRMDISTVPTWSTRKDISTVPTWSTPVAWPLKYSMSVFIQCCVNSRHVLIQNGVRMCGTVGDEFMRDN